MVRRSLRDRVLTPKVARAMMSPSGIVLAGAGAAVAIASGLGAAGVLVVGAGAWAARVAAAIPREPRPGEHVDPFALKDPWRRSVQQAVKAQRRFDGAARSAAPGALRDRQNEIGQRLDEALQECWRLAKQCQTLSDARAELDTTEADR